MGILLTKTFQTLYKHYLRTRLHAHARDLQAIAWQRENDFQAERILHRRMVEMQSKLRMM